MSLPNLWNRVLRGRASSRRQRTTGQRRNGAKTSRPNAKRCRQRLGPVLELLESRLTLSGVQYTAVAAGDPTSNDAILWTRALDPVQPQVLNLIAEVSRDPTFRLIDGVFLGKTDPGRDYTMKVDATGLRSGTPYYYRFLTGSGEASPVGKFKTAPDPTANSPLHFGFSGDAHGSWRPYDVAANFAAQNFDFFVFLGDTIYDAATAKSPAPADPYQNPQQALKDYRRKYREQLEPVNPGGFPGLQTFFASQANYTLLDNHELENTTNGTFQFRSGGAPAGTPPGKGVSASDGRNDVNTTGTFMNKTQGFQTLLQAYSDYQPIRERTLSAPADPRSDGSQQLYFAQQWGSSAIFFNLDDRSYRDIELSDTGPRADNFRRTMLGTTQLNWFERGLLDAQAQNIPWKFVAISSPIDQRGTIGDGPDTNKSWFGGYRAERNELLKFIADNHIDHVVFLTTDDHQVRINEVTYLANPKDPQSLTRVPGAFEVLDGPLGAQGPDGITNHTFRNLKSMADGIASTQIRQGIDPLGLDPRFPGLFNVFREGDPDADLLRQPVDFYSPDTFNYATLDVSADGGSLKVSIFGVNSYAGDTFPEPQKIGPERLILSFQISTLVADHFTLSAPASAIAGQAASLTLTARDPYGNIATGYTGTVTFASSDPQARLPASYTFTAADNGAHAFAGVTLFTAGAQTVMAQDTANASLTGSTTVAVAPAPADHFLISAASTAFSSTPFDVTLTALDPYGNLDTNYAGTVTWASSDTDPGVILPADYTFQANDSGTHTFSAGVTLITPGDQTLTATDTARGITGNATVTVAPGPRPPPGGSGGKRWIPSINAELSQENVGMLFTRRRHEGVVDGLFAVEGGTFV